MMLHRCRAVVTMNMYKVFVKDSEARVPQGGIVARGRRWMYRGHRPNWLARRLLCVDAAVAASRVTGTSMVSLEVQGRTSGRTIAVPVVVAIVDGERYVVSMLGAGAQWVRNMRAAGGRAVLHSGGRTEVRLVDVPTEQRAPSLKAYLQRAPGARPHIPVNKDAPLAAFEKVAAVFPIFRIVERMADEPRAYYTLTTTDTVWCELKHATPRIRYVVGPHVNTQPRIPAHWR